MPLFRALRAAVARRVQFSGFSSDQIEGLSSAPPPFYREERQFWADPYISDHVLHAHLDEHSDAGSRKPRIIRESSQWICDRFDERATSSKRPGARLLDLGCGPGLYAVHFQSAGFDVTGIDISPTAIKYASQHSVAEGNTTRYICSDYLSLSSDEEFDLVTCIYGGVGTCSDRRRADLFNRVYQALKPGGLFIFDCFTLPYVERERLREAWSFVRRDGFWSNQPHLVLEKSFLYPEASASVDSYSLLFEDGSSDRYFVWHRYYTRNQIARATEDAGFEHPIVYSDLCGTPWYEGSPWIGVIAQKPDHRS